MTVLEKGFVFDQNRPTRSCHASTVLAVQDGLLCAWFGGTAEGAKDVDIYMSFQPDGQGWQKPKLISAEAESTHWNPVLFGLGHHVTLFYKAESETIAEWKTLRRDSEDGGKTFSSPREVVPGDRSGGRGPVKNKPIRLKSGPVLAPASREYADGRWQAFIDRSEDGGETFLRSPYIPADENVKLIQPSLWENETGVHALLRSDQGFIFRSDSEDEGRTWRKAYATPIPNNNSGLDLVRMDDGRIVLAANPVGQNWGARSPLTLFVSENGGETFEKLMDVETEAGEYSYPALIAEGNTLYMTYTHRRERIAWLAFTL